MDTATVSSKYQVVIPRQARDALGIKAGDKVIFDYRDGVVVMLARPEDFASFMRGLGAEAWEGIDPREYLRSVREPWTK
ncbi:MAG: AbrB/MazE/SpoVT family DNA-binding domain-containing protein [Actinobacteria bacterium]|nr:AbrB/MazE/SpoVT family DNA-binding domain-containing protein [Actinomycetota bacterium]MBU1942616.1 AbrB/MazE/SpoVT family DNA-binding domain-containing protein [Actinomycetota bacterium]